MTRFIWPDSLKGNLIITASQIDLHLDALQHFNIIGLSFKNNTKDSYALGQAHWL